MTTKTATANFSAALSATKDAPPTWVQLFPAGPEIKSRDGRQWTANPAGVIEAFAANNGPLPIDYEHAQDVAAEKGQPAPAAGWIAALENRAGEIWGKVEWTERAAAMIMAREYRFLSPAFLFNRAGLVLRLLGAGLVNRPALHMAALSREDLDREDVTHRKPTETEMSLKAIAKALGLAEDADEKTVLEAISKRDGERATHHAAVCKALDLDPAKADTAGIATAVASLKAAPKDAGNKDAESKDAEIRALQGSLKDASKALASLQEKDLERDIDAALDAAAAEGKITPASREAHRAMCKAEGGLARFNDLVKTLPVICEPSKLDGIDGHAATARETTVNPDELAAKAREYMDKEAAMGRIVSASDAVRIVKELK